MSSSIRVNKYLERSRAFLATAVVTALLASGCTKSGPTGPSSNLKIYKSVWINASWVGGAAGPPVNVKSETPANWEGTLCQPSSLLMENHSTRYQSVLGANVRNELVIYNNCTHPRDLYICVTAGGTERNFPTCNTDPRTTPPSRLYIGNLDAANNGIRSYIEETTSANLDINIFYCADGSSFAAGVIPGTNATDCMAP
jgi:hypothetical protein